MADGNEFPIRLVVCPSCGRHAFLEWANDERTPPLCSKASADAFVRALVRDGFVVAAEVSLVIKEIRCSFLADHLLNLDSAMLIWGIRKGSSGYRKGRLERLDQVACAALRRFASETTQ